MKRKVFLTGVVTFAVLGSLIASRSTDAYYTAAAIGFFMLCIGYTLWCERL